MPVGLCVGLQLRGLCKSFGGLAVAQDLNLDLPPGARTALIGPNGAGKSTLAQLITGCLVPDQGMVMLDGVDLAVVSQAARVKRGIAKTFQITTLFAGLSLRENLRLAVQEQRGQGARWFGRADRCPEVEEIIEFQLARFGLLGLAYQMVGRLAYGQQRLVELALTLCLQPRVLVLDEPAAGVPMGEIPMIVEALEGLPKNLAVLLIDHDMDLVFRLAQHIVVMVAGTILAQGTPAEIATNATVQRLYLGEAFDA